MGETIRQMWSVLFRKKTVMNPGMWHTHLRGLSIVDVTCLGKFIFKKINLTYVVAKTI